jgi:apolipoprotein D and lipocalin family protein
MKYLGFFVLLLTPSLFSAVFGEDKPLETVAAVDLKRYAGKWYEVARLPNSFEKKCAGNVTAEYKLLDDGNIEVVNTCKETNGELSVAVGKARLKDKKTNSKLKVRFAPAFLSFLPFVWGDYWIIELGENYDYAVVASPDRKYFWVLSRTPEIEETRLREILQRANEKGFDTNKVIRTKQNS